MWIVIDASTGALISGPHHEAPEDLPAGQELVGAVPGSFVTGRSYWDPVRLGFFDRPILSPLAFQRRFTAAERVAIRASSDSLVIDWMELSKIAQEIDLSDPDVIAGVEYLEALALIGTGRAAAVLEGLTA
jgi:hypothetical protein